MKKSSPQMTAEMVKVIKEMLGSKQYHQHQIAALLGVNQGRISEVKNGFYD
jgi:predicted XRE-type DNA-binding protein